MPNDEDPLNLYVLLYNGHPSIHRSLFDSLEDQKEDIERSNPGEETVWNFMEYRPGKQSMGFSMLNAILEIDYVNDMFEDFLTAIFDWGRKYERYCLAQGELQKLADTIEVWGKGRSPSKKKDE